MSEKIRILFLAANPKDTTLLRLDEEIREIQTQIRAGEFRDHFELVSRWAVRPGDLIQALNEVCPHIVHFSGHGSESSELVIEDKDGSAKAVSEDALVSLFRNVKGNIRLALFNVCHSETYANAVSNEIECAIGMRQAIGDEAAIIFASSFYGALAFGLSIGEAFAQGRTALMLHGIPEESTPSLLVRPGVDALRLCLVERIPTFPILPSLAIEILSTAVSKNSPVNLVRSDCGVTAEVGGQQLDSDFDLRKAAEIEHAISMLVKVGWLKEQIEDVYYVTHPGFEAASRFVGPIPSAFKEIEKQMGALLEEMREGLQSDDGKFVREFFVLKKKGHTLGGSSKPRFVFYEEAHDNLRGKLDILENHGYLVDVTPGNTPIYRMTEEFVRLVLKSRK